MSYEVVVVGAGVGGLSVGALLAARGVNVCVLERASIVGGGATAYEHFGYRFDAGAGHREHWDASGACARILDELNITPPEACAIETVYIVRLPDGAEVRVGAHHEDEDFSSRLRAAFPECAEAAIEFYRRLASVAEVVRRVLPLLPDMVSGAHLQRLRLAMNEPRALALIRRLRGHTAAHFFGNTSTRFRRFIDAQLQTFALCSADDCSYLYAALALASQPRPALALRGGTAALTEALAASITRSGGTLRLDTPALRLLYDADGRRTAGVMLLSGESIRATRAVVSNLTVWDTYAKLVGHEHTPAPVRARLKQARGWGAYRIYLGLDQHAASRLASDRMLIVNDPLKEWRTDDPADAQFTLSIVPAWDAGRAPAGRRAATVSCLTDAASWFAYHEDEDMHEQRDQAQLERLWPQLHHALPGVLDGAEVIGTATPCTCYEQTRRKLGMVGGVAQTPDVFGHVPFTHRTPLPNLFLVGDTVFPGQGLDAVMQSALITANELTRP